MKQVTLLLSALLLTLAAISQQNVTIYQIQGQADESPYLGQVIATGGIVTGVFPAGFFLQDGEGEWNGVYVYTNEAVEVGDEITLTAEVDEYYELTELKNVDNLQIISSGNMLPAPFVTNTWDVNDESLEGVLVKIEAAVCTNPDLGYGEWELNDGTGPCRIDDLGIVYSPELGYSYSVTGPLYFSFDDYKIVPRDESDIQILENLYFVYGPEQTGIGTDYFTISWETNTPATTEAFYGPAPDDLQSYISVSPGDSVHHELEIPISSGELINYARPFSVSGEDTTQFTLVACALVSGSSGEIKVLFNHDVDETLAIEEPAPWTPDITDSVIAFIDMAQQNLDITMYEQESVEIVEAINDAYDRGVQIRYITDDEGTNPALENLNPNIPVLYGNTEAIMHNKFIVMDAADEMDCWVMTGSLNHTENNLGWDFNNVICIQDQSLAQAFTLEFEEMWGSDGPMYDEAAAKFGADKTDNTPHKFLIGGIPVDLYFSPSDGTTGQIAEWIDHAEDRLEFGIMVFTENSLGNAVLAAHQRDVEVTGIIDYVEYSGSEYGYLKDNGVHVRDYVNPDGTSWPDGPVFHHKYMIADFQEGSENAVLVTGSHNWSASAESINDENTLIIRDLNLANQFHQEFTERFHEQLTPVAMDDDTLTPVNTALMIHFLANDFIPEDISVSKDILVEPMHGLATMQAGEDFIDYFPEGAYIGYDSLSYTMVNSDHPQLADTAWVKIKVGNVGIEDLSAEPFQFGVSMQNGHRLGLFVKCPGQTEATIRIYDQLGRQFALEAHQLDAGENRFYLDAPDYTGVCFVEVQAGEYRKVKKVMIR